MLGLPFEFLWDLYTSEILVDNKKVTRMFLHSWQFSRVTDSYYLKGGTLILSSRKIILRVAGMAGGAMTNKLITHLACIDRGDGCLLHPSEIKALDVPPSWASFLTFFSGP